MMTKMKILVVIINMKLVNNNHLKDLQDRVIEKKL
mgnify:CR=1 FL=1